jgi:hypothetical protein
MITDTAHERVTRFFGLSTDTKPTNAMIGATFYETDTRHEFVYDGSWTRGKRVTVEQAGIVVVAEERNTTVILDETLVQMKIMNAHLALITGEKLTEEDL